MLTDIFQLSIICYSAFKSFILYVKYCNLLIIHQLIFFSFEFRTVLNIIIFSVTTVMSQLTHKNVNFVCSTKGCKQKFLKLSTIC